MQTVYYNFLWDIWKYLNAVMTCDDKSLWLIRDIINMLSDIKTLIISRKSMEVFFLISWNCFLPTIIVLIDSAYNRLQSLT